MTPNRIVTAAIVLIGDELLSGRTQDTNLRTLAQFLAPLGVQVRESRVVPDVHETIAATVNTLRKAHHYVFTTGGIGPTHDDITADAVAAAFNRKIGVRPDALAILEAYYAKRDAELNDSRRRMARIPDGAVLIANPVSGAPGFQIENVFVLAGIPSVVRGMLEDVGHRIEGGAIVHQHTVRAKGLLEGEIAVALGELAKVRPDVNFGSYPWTRATVGLAALKRDVDMGVNLVARSRDADALAAAVDALVEIVRAHGAKPEIDPKD
jgi:molybdenum cofactor synthesis domain-containing protein